MLCLGPLRGLSPVIIIIAPRIHRRLAQNISHRYSRYRPRYLYRPGGRGGSGYGSDAELAVGYLVDDPSDAYHGVFHYNQEAYFSMAEEKPDSEFSDSDQGSEVSSTTTPEADVAQNKIEDKAPIPRAPNTALLVLSWGVFATGLYFVYVYVMGTYNENVPELRLAVTFVLALLTFPIGMFLRRSAYHGFRQAFKDLLSPGSGLDG